MKQKMMKKREMITGLLVVTLLSWVTFHVLFKNHSIEILKEAFLKADLRYILPGIGCMFLVVNCEAANIRLLMRTFKKKVPYRRSLCYTFACFYFSAITPSATGGQPMQLYYMTRDGLGFAHSSFTALTVAAVYQMTVLVYGSFMAAANLAFCLSQGKLIQGLLVVGILINGICSGLILLTIFNSLLAERVIRRSISFLCKIKLLRNKKRAVRKMEEMINEYSRGGAYLRKYPSVIVRLFLHTVFQLTALYLVPYFAALSLGLHIGPGRFLALQAILSLAVTAVPLPGSVGASEGAFMALYRPGLGTGQAFSVLILGRAVSFYGMLVLSGGITAALQFRKKTALPTGQPPHSVLD